MLKKTKNFPYLYKNVDKDNFKKLQPIYQTKMYTISTILEISFIILIHIIRFENCPNNNID
jgi:hypothetical protein